MARLRFIKGALLLVLAPIIGWAEVPCPFLNAETAAGILGGEGKITTAVTITDKEKQDVTCEFVLDLPLSSLVLRIEVNTMQNWKKQFSGFLLQCPSHSENVRGIGNEAVACSGSGTDGKRFELILSRVRERSLSVRLTAVDPSAQKTAMRNKALQAADEVSGNLF